MREDRLRRQGPASTAARAAAPACRPPHRPRRHSGSRRLHWSWRHLVAASRGPTSPRAAGDQERKVPKAQHPAQRAERVRREGLKVHQVHPAWPQHRLTRTGLPPTGTGGGGVYALGLSPRLAQLRRGGRAHHYQAQPRAGRRGRANGADHAHVPGGHVRESTHVALAGRDGRARVAEEDDDARRDPGVGGIAKGRVAARCRRRLWRGPRLEEGLAAPRRTRSRVQSALGRHLRACRTRYSSPRCGPGAGCPGQAACPLRTRGRSWDWL